MLWSGQATMEAKRKSPARAMVQAAADTMPPQFTYAFYAARNSLRQMQYDEGMALLLFCKSVSPADAATLQSIGYMWQALQDPEKAEDYYRRAFEKDPKSYWSNYAVVLYNTDQLEEAARVLEEGVSQNPTDTDPLEALSTVYQALGETKKAIRVQDRIEQIEGITAYNTMNRYRLYAATNNKKKALQTIDRYLQDNPDDLRFRVFKADVLLQTGKEKEALAIYFAELNENPDNPYALFSLATYCLNNNDRQRGAEYIRRAILSDYLGLDEKLDQYKRNQALLAEIGMEEEILTTLTQEFPLEESVYQALLEYRLQSGDQNAAKEVMQTLLDLHPDNSRLWKQSLNLLLADSTTSNEDYKQVINRGYQLDTLDMEWRYWRCRVMLVDGELDSLVQFAETTLQLNGEARFRLPICIMLGDVYMLREEFENVYRVYNMALQIDPQNLYVLNNYAYTLAINGGDLRKAERMSQKTIEQDPENATYLDTYAWILHLQGQDLLAKFYIQKAMDNMQDYEAEDIREHYKIIIGK